MGYLPLLLVCLTFVATVEAFSSVHRVASRPAISSPSCWSPQPLTVLSAADNDDEEEKKGDPKDSLNEDLSMKTNGEPSNAAEEMITSSDLVEVDGQKKRLGFWGNLKQYVAPPDDGSNFRERLAKLGLAAALSYGWVSNMSYSVSVSLAWYIFSKRVSCCNLSCALSCFY